MPAPKKRAQPPPAQPKPRLAAVPAAPPDPPHPIPVAAALRLLAGLADRAEAAGDADTAAQLRRQTDDVAPGYEFQAFLRYRVTKS